MPPPSATRRGGRVRAPEPGRSRRRPRFLPPTRLHRAASRPGTTRGRHQRARIWRSTRRRSRRKSSADSVGEPMREVAHDARIGDRSLIAGCLGALERLVEAWPSRRPSARSGRARARGRAGSRDGPGRSARATSPRGRTGSRSPRYLTARAPGRRRRSAPAPPDAPARALLIDGRRAPRDNGTPARGDSRRSPRPRRRRSPSGLVEPIGEQFVQLGASDLGRRSYAASRMSMWRKRNVSHGLSPDRSGADQLLSHEADEIARDLGAALRRASRRRRPAARRRVPRPRRARRPRAHPGPAGPGGQPASAWMVGGTAMDSRSRDALQPSWSATSAPSSMSMPTNSST